jgi:predicted DsbA family dithiol-disulfide isomerase
LKQVTEEYGDKVRIVFKHLPLSFHDKAQLAAEASMAAHAQGKFWEYAEKLFENQQALAREDLERVATELGLDMEKFKAALDQGTYKPVVAKDVGLAGEIKASGTPTFFINGKLMEGGKAFEDFKSAIDAELEVVQKLVDKGTPKAKLYESLIAKGKVFTPLEDKVEFINTAGSPTLGKTPARITIAEFSEFQ